MGEQTTIEWCDHTFNSWRGCQKVAAGCANCYAEAQSKRNTGTLGIWGPNGTRVVAAESAWKQVEKWDREAAKAGESRSVFCGSMCDVFEDWPGQVVDSNERRLHVAPSGKWCPDGLGSPVGDAGWRPLTMSDVRNRVFNLIDATRLTWLLLTKRPENIRRFWMAREQSGTCVQDTELADRRRNVWLGTSIACQEDADRNIPELLKCRDLCAGLFLSIEPLIGTVDLSVIPLGRGNECQPLSGIYRQFCDGGVDHPADEQEFAGGPRIDQVIVGGESGPNARPCDVAWIRSIVRQCAATKVNCFVKQLGSNVMARCDDSFWYRNAGATCNDGSCRVVRLKDKKGGDPAEWPNDLRVRNLAWKGGA